MGDGSRSARRGHHIAFSSICIILLTVFPSNANSLSLEKGPTTRKSSTQSYVSNSDATTLLPEQRTFSVCFRQEGENEQQQRDRWSSPSSSSISTTEGTDSKNVWSGLVGLWNDQRSITTLVGDAVGWGGGGEQQQQNANTILPYSIESEDIIIGEEGDKFRVLVYPRGIAGRLDSPAASAYLRYFPPQRGRELDVSWTLRLVNSRTNKPLSVSTSGGLPLSDDTWTSAITFCEPGEDVESVGRANDWGASTWSSEEVASSLQDLRAELNITVFQTRVGESTFSWPIGDRGALGAVRRATKNAITPAGRTFRAGEVIVPTISRSPAVPNDDENTEAIRQQLEKCGVYPGVDYRIMTLSDKDGIPIFTTSSLPKEERGTAKLALRPVGWKRQASMWKRRGVSKWPVEVDASLLSQQNNAALTRFNLGSFFPRLFASFRLDAAPLLLACLLAFTPLPVTVFAREYVSFYAIPSSSMDPTLQKGDVLLVEKLPGVFDRTQRGDVVLFRPPSALDQIIGNSKNGNAKTRSSSLNGQSLFVKRVVGMPGDENIFMDGTTEEVTISGQSAVGPNRNLCDDEPLKLIDKLLENGKGKVIPYLGDDDVYVLGDCKVLSVDSRVWGTLPKDNIVGKPVARIWPLQRFSSGPF